MKNCVLCLLAVLLPVAVYAQEGIRVEEVGLRGFYLASVPTPVRIHIPALAQTQSIQLEFTIESRNSTKRVGPLRTDQFRKQIQVTSGQPLEIEVPILLTGLQQQNLHLISTDSHGQRIGEANVDLAFLKEASGGLRIAIYCNDERKCLDAQAQLSPIPTSEENANQTNQPNFALLKELRQNWWDYSAAQVLVLAGSVSGLSADQSQALEYYLRSGGTLVLLEKEVADTSFLAAYRHGATSPEFSVVGNGRLYRLPSSKSAGLRKITSMMPSNLIRGLTDQYVGQSAVQVVLRRVGISFSFPRLPWLLTWIAVYILVIGLVNFAILRRLRKLEWGWVTVCITALLFAAGLYITSSSRRPKNFTLDSARVYWMDEHSPVAHEDLGLRVSSPERTQIGVAINDDAVLRGPPFRAFDSSGVDIGAEVTDKARIQPGWQVQLGPPLEMEFPMLRWSFKDLYLEGFREFPGTVHWTSGMHLKNDTGQRFQEGIYLDFRANKRYAVPALAPGEEIDLAGITPKDIWKDKKKALMAKMEHDWGVKQPAKGHFSVEELPYSRFQFGPAHRVFVGVNDAPAANTRLNVAGVTGRVLALTVVSLDQP